MNDLLLEFGDGAFGDGAFGDVLTELSALGRRPAPEPSAELAALFADGAVSTSVLARRRRTGRIVAGAVLAGGITLGATGVAAAHDALPEPAQTVVTDVLHDLSPIHVDPPKVTPHVVRHAAPARSAPRAPRAPRHAAAPSQRTHHVTPVVVTHVPAPVQGVRHPSRVPVIRSAHIHLRVLVAGRHRDPGRHHDYDSPFGHPSGTGRSNGGTPGRHRSEHEQSHHSPGPSGPGSSGFGGWHGGGHHH